MQIRGREELLEDSTKSDETRLAMSLYCVKNSFTCQYIQYFNNIKSIKEASLKEQK